MGKTKEELIQEIQDNINTNGRQAITGQILQDVLVDMVGGLGEEPPFISGAGNNSAILRNSTSSASGDFAVAEGDIATALGDYSHAEGYQTKASGVCSHAESYSTIASGSYSHAEGNNTTASARASHAEGYSAIASGESSHAEGQGTEASGSFSHAEGLDTFASGFNSHAEGYSAIASGESSHAEGQDTIALGAGSHAEGTDTLSGQKAFKYSNTGSVTNQLTLTSTSSDLAINDVVSIVNGAKYEDCSIITNISGNTITFNSLPFDTIVDDDGFDAKTIYVSSKPTAGTFDLGQNSHSEGLSSSAQNLAAHAEGYNTKALGEYSHAEGRETMAQYTSHAEGWGTRAVEEQAHAEGYQTTASGKHSHAEGSKTIASGAGSHAEGEESQAIGNRSHAEGVKTISSGSQTHTEGNETVASNNQAHAEGNSTLASGKQSHAEGNSTTASGASSHAEGNSTTASGENSHTEGSLSHAPSVAAHAEGVSTMAGDENIIKIKLNNDNATTQYRLITSYRNIAYAYINSSFSPNPFLTINNNSVKTAIANYRNIYYNSTSRSGGLCNEWKLQTLIVENTSDNTIVGKYLINTAFRNVIKLPNSIIDGNQTPSYYGYPVADGQEAFKMFSFFSDIDYRMTSSFDNPDIQNGIFILNPIISISGTQYYATDLSNGDNLTLNGLSGKLNEQNTAIYLLYDFNKSTISGNDKAYKYFKSYDNNIIFGYAEGAHAEGLSSKAITTAAHAEGSSTTAEGDSSHAEGESSRAEGYASHAEGSSTTLGGYSHAEGVSSIARGYASHAEGYASHASGSYSHAEGSSTTSGSYSHAEGSSTTSGSYSHAEGLGSHAEGLGSHAEGANSTASGSFSHAEGYSTAFGEGSHAEGISSDLNVGNYDSSKFNHEGLTRAVSTTQFNIGRETIGSFTFNNTSYYSGSGIPISGEYCVPGSGLPDMQEGSDLSYYLMRPQYYTNNIPSGSLVLIIPFVNPFGSQDDSNSDFDLKNIYKGQTIDVTYQQVLYHLGNNPNDPNNPAKYVYDSQYFENNPYIPREKSIARVVQGTIIDATNYTSDYLGILTDISFPTAFSGSLDGNDNRHPKYGSYTWKDINLCAVHITGYSSGAHGNWSHTEGYGCNTEGSGSHAEGFYTETLNAGEHACGILNESGYMMDNNNGFYYVSHLTEHDTRGNRIIFSVGAGDPENGYRCNGLIITQNGDVYILHERMNGTGLSTYRKLQR